MNAQSTYDQIADQYASSVQASIKDSTSVHAVATQTLLEAIGNISNLDICDLACGEGYLSIELATTAHTVVGIDTSERLINLAKDKVSNGSQIEFMLDDAQSLSSQLGNSFDLVVSNLALMDIPNLSAVYKSVFSILRPTGRFAFSITHPCFQSPHSSIDTSKEGEFEARRISHYASEGFWKSEYPHGIRGQVGAIHRTLSSYINDLLTTGFCLSRLVEPTLPRGSYPNPFAQAQVEIPSVMIVVAYKPAMTVSK